MTCASHTRCLLHLLHLAPQICDEQAAELRGAEEQLGAVQSALAARSTQVGLSIVCVQECPARHARDRTLHVCPPVKQRLFGSQHFVGPPVAISMKMLQQANRQSVDCQTSTTL